MNNYKIMNNEEIKPDLTSSPIIKEEKVNYDANSESSIAPIIVKGSHKKLFIVLGLLGVLIITGGILAFKNYFLSPEAVVARMFKEISKVESFEYDAEIKAELKGTHLVTDGFALPMDDSSNEIMNKDEIKNNFTINFSGGLNIKDLNMPQSAIKINFKTDFLSGEESVFDLELRLKDNNLYILLNNIGETGIIDLSFLSKVWIKFDMSDLDELRGTSDSEKDDSDPKLSDEEIKKLKEIYSKIPLIKITEKLTNEKLNNESVYHFKYTLDKDALKKFIIEASSILDNKEAANFDQDNLDSSLEALESLSGEIWISKKDFLPRKLSFISTYKETSTSKISGNITTMISFKNFNNPFNVEVPNDTKPFEEIIEAMFMGTSGGFMMGSGFESDEEFNFDLDTDLDGLPDSLEKIYKTNPNNPDTDGDGFKDGEEVGNGYNPLGPGKLNF